MATPGAYQNVAGKAFEHQIGQKCNPMRSQAPENTFIAHIMLKYVYSDLFHIMLWVAGGNCATKMCNRIRGERYRGTRLVTLPYLTLNLV